MTDAAQLPGTRWWPREGERFNFCTHAGGLLIALTGACWMLGWMWGAAGWAVRLGVLIYLGALVGTFAASSTLHFLSVHQATLQRLDHSMIFALIAGTCTPFVAATASNAFGPWAMLSLLWVVAATSIRRQWNGGATATAPAVESYAALACLAVVGAAASVMGLNDGAFAWLWIGAGIYGVGVLFYRNRGGLRHSHGIWHLLVIAGAGAHYVGICLLLATSVGSPGPRPHAADGEQAPDAATVAVPAN